MVPEARRTILRELERIFVDSYGISEFKDKEFFNAGFIDYKLSHTA